MLISRMNELPNPASVNIDSGKERRQRQRDTEEEKGKIEGKVPFILRALSTAWT